MMNTEEKVIMVQETGKIVVLLIFTLYIGYYFYILTKGSQHINLPDGIVMIVTMVFQSVFRKSNKISKDKTPNASTVTDQKWG